MNTRIAPSPAVVDDHLPNVIRDRDNAVAAAIHELQRSQASIGHEEMIERLNAARLSIEDALCIIWQYDRETGTP